MNIYTLFLKVAIIFLLFFLHFSQFNRTFAQHFEKNVAPVAKLVDALDLGSNVSRCAGSSPVRRTKKTRATFLLWSFLLSEVFNR